jgi:hypothetical protein
VPLDYGDPSSGTTAIAFIKLAAQTISEDTQNVLVNPGKIGFLSIRVLLRLTDARQVVQVVPVLSLSNFWAASGKK